MRKGFGGRGRDRVSQMLLRGQTDTHWELITAPDVASASEECNNGTKVCVRERGEDSDTWRKDSFFKLFYCKENSIDVC